MRKIVAPKFKTEKEEAKWWDDHLDVVGKKLLEAMKHGTAHRGGLPPCCVSRAISRFALPTRMSSARKLAEEKGIGYQTYMKMLLREALDREEKRARKAG